jgi:hypothetical protein
LWTGAAASAGWGAKLMWEVYGTRAAPEVSMLAMSGWWERYWRLWFDRGHGIAVENPVLLLWFWAAPVLVWRAWWEKEWRPAAVLGATAGAYAAMFGLVPTYAGESAPGRYLCAMAPLALAAILAWVKERELKARAAAVGALAAVSVAMVVEGMWGTAAWQALGAYQDLFPRGWPAASFVHPRAAAAGDSAVYGWALLAAVAATEAAGMWSRRSAGEQGELMDGPPVHGIAASD